MSYRAGLPGWKLFARAGMPISLRVNVVKDDEADVYVGSSPDLRGLVVEAPTLEELRLEINGAASRLLALELHRPPMHAKTDIRLRDAVPCGA
jgi:predicted RNase H-like HicB family nuclease